MFLGGAPTSRQDPRGAFFVRLGPGRSNRYIDSWYALNGIRGDSMSADGGFMKYPFRAYPAFKQGGRDYRLQKFLKTTRSSELVLAFDGNWSHDGSVAAAVNARHSGRTMTNLLLGDGHANSVVSDRLPDNPGQTRMAFGKSSMPLVPKWRLDEP